MAPKPLTAAEAEILAGLDPEFQPIALRHRQLALDAGLPFVFLSGIRSRAQQAAEATRAGRTTPAAAPGKSKHEIGFAYDLERQSGAVERKVGELGESLGLEWGGRYATTPDPNHYEAPQSRASLAAYRAVKISLGVALLAAGTIAIVEGG